MELKSFREFISEKLHDLPHDVKALVTHCIALSNEAYQNTSNKGMVTEIDEQGNKLFIAFRGTRTSTLLGFLRDMFKNLQVGMTRFDDTEMKVHSGFYKVYQQDLKDLQDLIAKNKNKMIIFTGHSQGAAIAALFYLHYKNLNSYLICFGMPLLGSQEVHELLKANPERVFILVHDTDPIGKTDRLVNRVLHSRFSSLRDEEDIEPSEHDPHSLSSYAKTLNKLSFAG